MAFKVELGDIVDIFVICGCGVFYIMILIEIMCCEGYEFMIGLLEVIMKKDVDGYKVELYEEVFVEVSEEYTGSCVDLFVNCKG